MAKPLWTPSPERLARAALTRFGDGLPYEALYARSLERPLEFWDAMWDFGGVIGDKGARIAIDMDRMPGARFFPDARLNFAENVLRGDGNGEAIVYRSESGVARAHEITPLCIACSTGTSANAAAGLLMSHLLVGTGRTDRPCRREQDCTTDRPPASWTKSSAQPAKAGEVR